MVFKAISIFKKADNSIMIVTIIGARPQFIKAAILSKAFKEAGIPELIIHTGQHYDYEMSQVFFDELELPKDRIDLNIGSGSQGKQTAEMLSKIEVVLLEKRNLISAVLVYGDTNSTLSAALAAAKLQIPVIHVEAGLRSFNKTMPEEINRITTDHVSAVLFCSSETGKLNLINEGIKENVYIVGDIMYDAFTYYSHLIEKQDIFSILPPELIRDYYLFTLHRPVNNRKEVLEEILYGLSQLEYNIVWPVHPTVKHCLKEIELPSNVFIFPPFSYLQMLLVLKHAKKVITDSGGLQKEAYWSKKPCITLRDETEWTETLTNNWNILTSCHRAAILQSANINVEASTWLPLYGNGNAATEIIRITSKRFSLLGRSLMPGNLVSDEVC